MAGQSCVGTCGYQPIGLAIFTPAYRKAVMAGPLKVWLDTNQLDKQYLRQSIGKL